MLCSSAIATHWWQNLGAFCNVTYARLLLCRVPVWVGLPVESHAPPAPPAPPAWNRFRGLLYMARTVFADQVCVIHLLLAHPVSSPWLGWSHADPCQRIHLSSIIIFCVRMRSTSVRSQASLCIECLSMVWHGILGPLQIGYNKGTMA